MASQNVTPASPPAAHVVGQAFVEQYYHILHLSPDMVHGFYQDTSILGRPDLDGVMSSVTTMRAINEKIMSLNYGGYKFEIETVDAQHSYKEGVLVLVTGSLVGKDNVRRKFTQSFFLAPQDKGGYFVLNDVFRYVGEHQTKEDSNLLDDDPQDFATSTPASPNRATTNLLSEEDIQNSAEATNQLENGGPVEEELVDQPIQPSHHDVPLAPEVTTTIEGVPKKSYASIVKVMKGNSTPSTIYVPTAKAKVAPAKAEKQASAAIPISTPEATTPSRNDVHESSNPQEEVEGHSIYVRNLPLSATPADVEEEFKKFGLIKPGGVQVRNHRQYGYCFGFVEFESESSMHAAIEGDGGKKDKYLCIRAVNLIAPNYTHRCNILVTDNSTFFYPPSLHPNKSNSPYDVPFSQLAEGILLSSIHLHSIFTFQHEKKRHSKIAHASPVTMGSQRVIVEAKRTTTRVVDGGSGNTSGRGQFPLGRGGFWNDNRFHNDNFRGRGVFSGGQGYGRNEFMSQGGFSSRGRGISARAIGVYQSGGRNFPPSGMNQIAVPA